MPERRLTRRMPLAAVLVAGILSVAGCGSSHTSTRPAPTLTTPPATSPPTATTPTTTTSTTGSNPPHQGGATTNHSSPTPAASSPTPQQVAKAQQALALCQKENPGITLKELEREAASPHGIQC